MKSQTLIQYVKQGPDAGGNSLLRSTLGFWLWWRMWAMMVIAIISLIVLMNYGPSNGDNRFWGYMVGGLTMVAINEVMD